MEPRYFKRAFVNPFTDKKRHSRSYAWYKGFFRAMPLHRWSLAHTERVLDIAASRPSMFGLPDLPTAIVNPAYFLPSLRSRQSGTYVFGTERGCKSIVVPSSMSNEGYDVVDAKLIEPLFRWNPGVEYLYLSRQCQTMTPQLLPHLSKLKNITRITLEGWNDAAAIHRIVMVCKNVEVLDTYGVDTAPREWKSELSVQALTTLIEMHPKLRSVESQRAYLSDWFYATQHSRCKHNIALVPSTCNYVPLWTACYTIVVCLFTVMVFNLVRYVTEVLGGIRKAWSVFYASLTALVFFAAVVADDYVNRFRRGRTWVHMQKYAVLLLWRLSRRRPVASSAITTRK